MTAPLYHFEKGLIEEQRVAREVGKHELDVLKPNYRGPSRSRTLKLRIRYPHLIASQPQGLPPKSGLEMEELVRQISETPGAYQA